MRLRTYKIPMGSVIIPGTRVGPPAYTGALMVRVEGTNKDWAEIQFDDGTSEPFEDAMFEFPVPQDYQGGARYIRFRWKSAAIVGNVRWVIAHEPVGNGDPWDAAFTGGPMVAVSTSAGVSGNIVEETVAVTGTAWEHGQNIYVHFRRTGPLDTMLGDALLVDVDVIIEGPGVMYEAARCATTANIAAFAGGTPLVVDGVTVAANDIVLVHNQTAGDENGIYQVVTPGTGADGTWIRAPGFDENEEVYSGLQIYVSEGTTYARCPFALVTANPITVGVTSLEFVCGQPFIRSDGTSFEIGASGAFTSPAYTYTSNFDMRDYRDHSVWVIVTDDNGGAITAFDIVCEASDDGATVVHGALQSDDTIVAGAYTANDYVGTKNFVGAGTYGPFSFPRKGGNHRIGIAGNGAGGAYSVRTQRFV